MGQCNPNFSSEPYAENLNVYHFNKRIIHIPPTIHTSTKQCEKPSITTTKNGVKRRSNLLNSFDHDWNTEELSNEYKDMKKHLNALLQMQLMHIRAKNKMEESLYESRRIYEKTNDGLLIESEINEILDQVYSI
eukprot:6798_1